MVLEWFLSVAAIGASALLESTTGRRMRTTTSSDPVTASAIHTSSNTTRKSSIMLQLPFGQKLSDSHRMLLSGVVLGIGLSILMSSLNDYFRFVPSVRVFWRFMTNTDESKNLFPYRIPSCAKDCSKGLTSKACLQQEAEEGKNAASASESNILRTLVNPAMAATPNLHVQYVTLPPHYELPPRTTRSVEFYYIISGSGVFSQQGIPQRQPLTAGDCCVVDAHNMRWIKNTGESTTNLVMLRVTDGPCGQDRIRMDPNHKNQTSRLEAPVAMIANGLRVLQDKANQYYNTEQPKTPSKYEKLKVNSDNRR